MIFFAPLAILGMAIFVAIGGQIVLHLWNWLLPSLFSFPQITFWQAIGLLALCRILFGAMGGRGSGRGRSDYRRRMADRWERMTPEERERLRQGWRGRWGFCPSVGESEAS
ncbi:MAG TPA: hypothetical protein VGS22_05310 [Thermoanaerobaculia bacterium]|nr:hypothetical protein [Thermoanaerobaculia bacterium]